MLEDLDTQFTRAQTDWDLDRLYQDLAKTKGKPLSPMEKLHLRGLLCGYSPNQIAKILRKNPKGVHVDLAKTLYPYLEGVVHKVGVENWRNVREWLEKIGYRKIKDSSQLGQSLNTVSQPLNTGTIVNILTASIVEIHAETIYIGENEYIDINFRVGPFSSINPPKKDKQN